MKKIKLGIFGKRGMVGRTLIKRLKKRYYKDNFDIYYLENTHISNKIHIIISCKGNYFSKFIIKKIKKKKWNGYFIDTSSFLRKTKTIILDPLNKKQIIKELKIKEKFFTGGNCTVSLMLISILGIIKLKISKIYCTTFQSVSGGGFKLFNSLLKQNRKILNNIKKNKFFLKSSNIKKITKGFNETLCYSLIPWIDKDIKNGSSKEEEKNYFETNKILNINKKIRVFSTCVRVNSLRCHSLSLVIKFKKELSLKKFNKLISNNKYIKIVKNNKEETLKYLNPIYCSEKKKIFVGRIKKLCKKEFSIFIVGDQLLWGAIEPVVRMLKIIKKNVFN
ncbi:aspartate-semialdehyde dehydrogenase [Candidatus Vidania fulgoroideae]|uniref:Aspartate-semialdehyde dehydrogenase n=1 Tax=Candidatus Vidania fulgoroideorum TaxID=881286 RepID=A0AAX3N8B3_9PROT|nr:aspartate-semialdehyde dehydrogenase [Candidatus Vidania fulgoroideae]